MPLTPAELQKLTPGNIWQLHPGAARPDLRAPHRGADPRRRVRRRSRLPEGASGDRRLAEIVGGLPGLAVELKLHRVEDLGRTLWKGKVFYRDERVLRNRIEDLALLKPIVDGDTATIQKISVDGKDEWLLFPAKLYCGQSLLDCRRESIIIDYFFTDEIPGYRAKPDFLAGRDGLRCATRSAWCGPASTSAAPTPARVFLLNFTLYNKAIAERDGPAFAAERTCDRGLLDRHAGAAAIAAK